MTFENGYIVDGDFFATIKIVHLLEKSDLTQSRTIQFSQRDMWIECAPIVVEVHLLQYRINLSFECYKAPVFNRPNP